MGKQKFHVVRDKEITVLHNGRTGEWVDIDRDQKVKSLLQKIIWLEDIIQECIEMDIYYDRSTPTKVETDFSLIEVLKRKLEHNRLITKSDMGLCNAILKNMKREYKFNTDWRGNIVDCEQYTKYKLMPR